MGKLIHNTFLWRRATTNFSSAPKLPDTPPSSLGGDTDSGQEIPISKPRHSSAPQMPTLMMSGGKSEDALVRSAIAKNHVIVVSTPIHRQTSRMGHILNVPDIEEHEEAVPLIPKNLKGQVVRKEVTKKIDIPRRKLSKRRPPNATIITTTEVQASRSASRTSQSSNPEIYAPGVTPRMLFKHETGKLFTGIRDPKELLVYATGACDNDGQAKAQAGCGFVYRCSDNVPRPWNPPKGVYCMHGGFWFRLEDVGPTNRLERHTRDRAALRATIAAMGWAQVADPGPAFWTRGRSSSSSSSSKPRLIIATDSSYIVSNATKRLTNWPQNNWLSSRGDLIQNQDLWEVLLERYNELIEAGCEKISFWLIERKENIDAGRLASFAASLERRPFYGILSKGGLPILIDPSQR